MNAMEHGNEYRADRPVVDPRAPPPTARARADHRPRRRPAELPSREVPDLEAKLEGRQKPAAGACS